MYILLELLSYCVIIISFRSLDFAAEQYILLSITFSFRLSQTAAAPTLDFDELYKILFNGAYVYVRLL